MVRLLDCCLSDIDIKMDIDLGWDLHFAFDLFVLLYHNLGSCVC